MDVTALTSALEQEPCIVCAYLFGSFARGTARPSSDIDVAVLADVDANLDRASWRWDLEARLARTMHRTVQIVDVSTAPADLMHRIVRDGKLLVDRDRSRRVALEVRKLLEYFDMTPVWRRIRRLPEGVAP